MPNAPEIYQQAAETWAANPHLQLCFADLGTFAQAYALRFRESAGRFAELRQSINVDQTEARALADARLQQIRAPGREVPSAAAIDRQGPRLTIWAYGHIGTGALAADEVCGALAANRDVAAIVLRIASAGGLAEPARRIAQALLDHQSRVVAVVDRYALSSASLIASTAHRVLIRRSATWMAHCSLAASDGDHEAHMRQAGELQAVDCRMAATYASRRPLSHATARRLLREGQYLSAAEAVEIGAADRIINDLPDWSTAQ